MYLLFLFAAILVAVTLILMGPVLLYCIKRFHLSKFQHSLTNIINADQSDKQSPGDSEVDMEMKKCGAYEVVRLSRQRVTMKDNPAYVDVNIRTLA